MNRTTAKINATPAELSEHQQRDMTVDLVTKASDRRGGEFKFAHEFGPRNTELDHLMDLQQDSLQWHFAHNAEVILQCRVPSGQRISHVEVKLDISSTSENVRIVNGGIGRDFIELALVGRNTYWLKYQVRFYGRQREGYPMHKEEVLPRT